VNEYTVNPVIEEIVGEPVVAETLAGGIVTLPLTLFDLAIAIILERDIRVTAMSYPFTKLK
jgi:hypothetical protein